MLSFFRQYLSSNTPHSTSYSSTAVCQQRAQSTDCLTSSMLCSPKCGLFSLIVRKWHWHEMLLRSSHAGSWAKHYTIANNRAMEGAAHDFRGHLSRFSHIFVACTSHCGHAYTCPGWVKLFTWQWFFSKCNSYSRPFLSFFLGDKISEVPGRPC